MLKVTNAMTRRGLYWAALTCLIVAVTVASAGRSSGSNGGLTASEKQLAAERRRQTKRVYTMLDHISRICVYIFLSAVFAGLTLGVMCADLFTLEIIAESGPAPDCKYAATILPLRKSGHRTLCTLIVSNMLLNVLIAQEFTRVFEIVQALRISRLGYHGDAASNDHTALLSFVVSTLVILIFAEIIPMSVCKSKASLKVAAAGAIFVKVAMVITYPVSAPLGKMLDWIVGSTEAGQIYDRKELRKLMVMHYEREGSNAIMAKSELNLLLAALDFQERLVRDIMTPIEKVTFVNESDLVTPDFLARIWLSGRSRVPVRNEAGDFTDVLLVRDLMSVNMRDDYGVIPTVANVVKQSNRLFAMVCENTSMPTMLKFFQEAKTHMAFVYAEEGADEKPVDDDRGILNPGMKQAYLNAKPTSSVLVIGIVTMEDVVEGLLNDEIYDEYDRYETEGAAVDGDAVMLIDGTSSSPVGPRSTPSTLGLPAGMKLPREPRRPPRVNFYSYARHSEVPSALSEAQVWAVAYFLNRTTKSFFAWSPPFIKLLLDECGDEQLVPASAATPAELPTPASESTLEHVSCVFETFPQFPPSEVLRGDHSHFLNQAQDESFILYTKGIRSEVFTLVLGGQVDLLVGNENFFSRLHSFNSLGEEALASPFFVPDFSAIVRHPVRCYRISRTLYDKYLGYQSVGHQQQQHVHVIQSPLGGSQGSPISYIFGSEKEGLTHRRGGGGGARWDAKRQAYGTF